MLPAEPAQLRELAFGVDGAQFGGVGDVDQFGLDHVLIHVEIQNFLDVSRPELALLARGGDHFVSSGLNRPASCTSTWPVTGAITASWGRKKAEMAMRLVWVPPGIK